METNELPEEAKRKIDEWCESFKTGEWFENLRKEAMTEGYRLALQSKEARIKFLEGAFDDMLKTNEGHVIELQSKEEEVKRLKNDLLDALDLKEGNGPTALSMLKSANDSLEEQLKAKDEEIAKLKFNVEVGDARIQELSSEIERLRGLVRKALLDASQDTFRNIKGDYMMKVFGFYADEWFKENNIPLLSQSTDKP